MELHEVIDQFASRHAAIVGHNISKVSNVAIFVPRRAVILAEWIVVRTSAEASLGKIGELVNMKAVLAWRKAFDAVRNLAHIVR